VHLIPRGHLKSARTSLTGAVICFVDRDLNISWYLYLPLAFANGAGTGSEEITPCESRGFSLLAIVPI
jgi:hypothetical protein